jgi:hypothetical protein
MAAKKAGTKSATAKKNASKATSASASASTSATPVAKPVQSHLRKQGQSIELLTRLISHVKASIATFQVLKLVTGFRFDGTDERGYVQMVQAAQQVATTAQDPDAYLAPHKLEGAVQAAERIGYKLQRTFDRYITTWAERADRQIANIRLHDEEVLEREVSRIADDQEALRTLLAANVAPAKVVEAYNRHFNHIRTLSKEGTRIADEALQREQQDRISDLGADLEQLLAMTTV